LQEPRLVLDAARRNVEWFAQYVKQEKTTSAGASNP
jgi:hypothetical protein